MQRKHYGHVQPVQILFALQIVLHHLIVERVWKDLVAVRESPTEMGIVVLPTQVQVEKFV